MGRKINVRTLADANGFLFLSPNARYSKYQKHQQKARDRSKKPPTIGISALFMFITRDPPFGSANI
jgi:hypothetical protein